MIKLKLSMLNSLLSAALFDSNAGSDCLVCVCLQLCCLFFFFACTVCVFLYCACVHAHCVCAMYMCVILLLSVTLGPWQIARSREELCVCVCVYRQRCQIHFSQQEATLLVFWSWISFLFLSLCDIKHFHLIFHVSLCLTRNGKSTE